MLEEALAKYPELIFVGHSQAFWIEMSKDAPTGKEERSGRGEGKVIPGGRVPELFRKYPNLYGDLSAGSGFCALARDEEFGLAFMEEFQDRLMYGSDCVGINTPWAGLLSEWLEKKYAEGAISQEVMEKICYRNAEKLYGM